jgi:hypothetical protein
MTELIQHPYQEPWREVIVAGGIFYHGSATPGIRDFDVAEEDTIGRGLYLLDNAAQAAGYALLRARCPGDQPILYTMGIDQARMVDLDDDSTLQAIAGGFRRVILNRISDGGDDPWHLTANLHKAIETIDNGVHPGRLKQLTFGHGNMFSAYLRTCGFDGLKAAEGGEGTIGAHHSYVLFDPLQARVIAESPVELQ